MATREPFTRPRRRPVVLVWGLLALALGVLGMPRPAAAATAPVVVGNGLTTTDLSAVGMTPAGLAAALVGPGVSVSNVQYAGANAQAGLIHLVDPAVVSFNDGVILSSGNIADIVGPNKSDGTTGDMMGPADADLNGLIANTQTVNPVTFDRAVLEFDFVPSASQVYFTYTFGSDEYLEWVNLFNDVFAFYVNGLNCATTPDGSAVSIDTINSAVNSALFRDNSYSSPPANPINIESDGLSVEMICSAPVNPGVVNHLKLAIADTSDQILDSVVMIKSHSLSTTAPESCNNGVDDDSDSLVDDSDPSCTSTTTPPPVGGGGIGTGGQAPAFTGNEGTPIPLDASVLGWTATPDSLTTTWSVTGINGTVGTCEIVPATPQPVGPGGAVAVVSAICPNEGEYAARVDGWDVEAKSAWDDNVDFFVHNAPPAVSIDAPLSGTQVGVGEVVGLSASVVDPGVNDAVSCTIDWGDGTTDAVVPAAGVCAGSHAYASTGDRLVSVTATDDAGDSAAAASLVSVVDTSTTVASNVNPSLRGQAVKLTATTTLGSGGTMSFYDGTTLLGTRTVSGGSASLTTTTLPAGSHAVTAVYLATPSAVPSTSPVLTQDVLAADTTTTLTSAVNPSVTGQTITVKAVVKAVAPGGGYPAGTVDLYDDGTWVASKALAYGQAGLTVKLGAGSHALTAVYAGSSDHNGSTTATPLTQVVNPAPTSTTLTSGANPSVVGQSVTLKAVVKAVAPGSGGPTGTVSFYDNGVLVGSRALFLGQASLALKPTVGSHTYTATYGGSSAYLTSTTAAGLTQQVDPAATAATLTSSANPSTTGQSVTIKATVKAVAPGGGTPTGTVRFYDGATLVATRSLFMGVAQFPATPSTGSHSYTAVYVGSASYLGTTSAPLVQTVS